MKKIFAVMGAVFMIASAMVVIMPQNEVRAITWWNGNWDYRQEVVVTNGGAAAVNNATVRIDVNTTNGFTLTGAQSDGDDIRFVNAEHTASYTYWCEYFIWPTATWLDATYWVNVTTLNVGDNSVWVYWGNPLATTESNGSAVFAYFDDFYGYANHNWTKTTGRPFGDNTVYEKTDTVQFSLIGSDDYWENSGVINRSWVGDYSVATRYPGWTTNYYMTYGSMFDSLANAAVCGASSTTGTSWTKFTNNPLVNCSALEGTYNYLQVTEPCWSFNSTYNQADPFSTYGKRINPNAYNNDFNLYYTCVNDTNISIGMSYAANLDADYTDYGGNPVLNATPHLEGEGVDWDDGGVRCPVVINCTQESEYVMFYAGLNSSRNRYEIGWAYSIDGVNFVKGSAGTNPMINCSAWGWDNCSVKPVDFVRNEADDQCYLLYCGQTWDGSWRLGWATCDYSDEMHAWNSWVKVGGCCPLGDASSFDNKSCHYGTFHTIDMFEGFVAPGTEYANIWYTGTNDTYTTLSTEVLRDCNWDMAGDSGQNYCVYPSDTFGQGLRSDWNNTRLINDACSGTNIYVSYDFWPTNPLAATNVSLYIKDDGGALGAETNRNCKFGTTNSSLEFYTSGAGTEVMMAWVDASAAIYGADQYRMSLSTVADTNDWITPEFEGMTTNVSVSAPLSITANQNTGVGLGNTYSSPMHFDYFRLNWAVNSTVYQAGAGEEQGYDDFGAPQEGDEGGGGTQTEPETDTDGDGIPDSEDPDDDNDGVPDAEDAYPLDATRWEAESGGWLDDLCGVNCGIFGAWIWLLLGILFIYQGYKKKNMLGLNHKYWILIGFGCLIIFFWSIGWFVTVT